MELPITLPDQFLPLLEEMAQVEGFQKNREGMEALIRTAIKDHAQTLANRCLENRNYLAAQKLVDQVNEINRELFPPATARAAQLIFVSRTKKGQRSWQVKELFTHKGDFYETVNPDGNPGKPGVREKESLTERMASEVLVGR